MLIQPACLLSAVSKLEKPAGISELLDHQSKNANPAIAHEMFEKVFDSDCGLIAS